MARDPRYVSVELLTGAAERARPILKWSIESVELKGSFVRVKSRDETIYFQVDVSPNVEMDQTTGKTIYLAGGESYDLTLLSKEDAVSAEAAAVWKDEVAARQLTQMMAELLCVVAMVFAVFGVAIGFWLRSR